MRLLRGHTAPIHCLAYSPDGRLLAAGASNDLLKLFDLAAGREQATWTVQKSNHAVRGVAFLDGRTVASLTEYWEHDYHFVETELRLWDLSTGYNSVTLTGRPPRADELGRSPGWFASLGCDPTSRTVAVGGYDGAVRLWTLPEEQPRTLRGGHRGRVWSVAFSPGSSWLASGGADWTVRVWDLPRGEVWRTHSHRGMVRAVAFAPDSETLATAAGPIVKLWSVPDGHERALLRSPKKYAINSLAFSPDGRTLATAGDDRRVRFWDVDTATEQVCYDWKVGKLNAVAFAPDGLTAAAAGDGRVVVVWDVDN